MTADVINENKVWNMQAAINDVMIDNGMRFNENHPDFNQAAKTAEYILSEYSDWDFNDGSDFAEAAQEWFDDTMDGEPTFFRRMLK